MRVSIQSPTQRRPVEYTAFYLGGSDSYDVMLERVSSASEPNIAVRLTLTIRNVNAHVGTRYHCVQHRTAGTIRSGTLVINKSELIGERCTFGCSLLIRRNILTACNYTCSTCIACLHTPTRQSYSELMDTERTIGVIESTLASKH